MDEVDAFDALVYIVGDHDTRTCLRSAFLGHFDHVFVVPVCLRSNHADIAAHDSPQHEQGVAHIVAGIAKESVADLRARFVGMLDHGQYVRQHLGRVPVVGETVIDRHARIFGELFHLLLSGATEFDRVEHAAQNPGGILHPFLVADLAA